MPAPTSVATPRTVPYIDTTSWVVSTPSPECLRRSVLEQREDVVALQPLAAVQELELDDERQPDDLAAELLDELDRRLRGPARRQHVVVDQDALALDDRVGVHLQRVEAVFERVLRCPAPPRHLAGLTG